MVVGLGEHWCVGARAGRALGSPLTWHAGLIAQVTECERLAADANEVLIETLEIQHEGFTEVAVGGA